MARGVVTGSVVERMAFLGEMDGEMDGEREMGVLKGVGRVERKAGLL